MWFKTSKRINLPTRALHPEIIGLFFAVHFIDVLPHDSKDTIRSLGICLDCRFQVFLFVEISRSDGDGFDRSGQYMYIYVTWKMSIRRALRWLQANRVPLARRLNEFVSVVVVVVVSSTLSSEHLRRNLQSSRQAVQLTHGQSTVACFMAYSLWHNCSSDIAFWNQIHYH